MANKMSWKDYLISKGFRFNNKEDYYIKSGGFGSKTVVFMIVRGLFQIEVNDKVVCIEWNKSTASIGDGHCRVLFILASTKENSILTREKRFVVENSNQNVVAAITLAFVSVRCWLLCLWVRFCDDYCRKF